MLACVGLVKALVSHHLDVMVAGKDALGTELLNTLLGLLEFDDFLVAHIVFSLVLCPMKQSRTSSSIATAVVPHQRELRQPIITRLLNHCGQRFVGSKPISVLEKDDSDDQTRLFNR
jgi:hypothetical protein